MTHKTSDTDILAIIARRHSIKASGIEALYLTIRKIDALITRTHADLEALHEWARQHGHLATGSMPPLGKAMPAILDHLRNGNRIAAVKLYRDATDLSLRDALDAVNVLQTNHSLPPA